MSRPNLRSPKLSTQPSRDGGGFLRGFLEFLFLPVYLVWMGAKLAFRWVWFAPKSIQLLISILVLLTLCGGFFVLYRMNRNAKLNAAPYHWAEFGTAALQSDSELMTKALTAILALKPDDTFAKNRLEALQTGVAEESDGQMCWLMTRIHLRGERMTDAVREAKKRLVSEPKDWLCNCVLARDALNRDDKESAKSFLDAVVNPDATPTKPDLGMVLFAVELREKAGLDATELRAFLFSRVLPNLRNVNLSQIKPAGKIQIVFSYATSVASIPEVSLGSTLQYWAFASQLADQTVTDSEEEKNAVVLTQIASLQSVLSYCVSRYLKAGSIRADEAATMTKECDARAEAAWRALKNVAPQDVNGYAGTAAYLIKANRYAEAEAEIALGFEKTKMYYPQLLRLYVLTMAHRDRPEDRSFG